MLFCFAVKTDQHLRPFAPFVAERRRARRVCPLLENGKSSTVDSARSRPRGGSDLCRAGIGFANLRRMGGGLRLLVRSSYEDFSPAGSARRDDNEIETTEQLFAAPLFYQRICARSAKGFFSFCVTGWTGLPKGMMVRMVSSSGMCRIARTRSALPTYLIMPSIQTPA